MGETSLETYQRRLGMDRRLLETTDPQLQLIDFISFLLAAPFGGLFFFHTPMRCPLIPRCAVRSYSYAPPAHTTMRLPLSAGHTPRLNPGPYQNNCIILPVD